MTLSPQQNITWKSLAGIGLIVTTITESMTILMQMFLTAYTGAVLVWAFFFSFFRHFVNFWSWIRLSCSSCPHISPHVPKCPHMSPNVPKCPQMSPKCPQMSPNVLKCPQISPKSPNVLKCPQMFAKCPENVSDAFRQILILDKKTGKSHLGKENLKVWSWIRKPETLILDKKTGKSDLG